MKLHDRCNRAPIYDDRHRGWYCAYCRMWISGEEDRKQMEELRQQVLKSLAPPRLAPKIQIAPGRFVCGSPAMLARYGYRVSKQPFSAYSRQSPSASPAKVLQQHPQAVAVAVVNASL